MQTIERDAANLDLLLRAAVSNAASLAQKDSDPSSLPQPVSSGVMQAAKLGEAGAIGDENSNGVSVDFSANSRRVMIVQLSPGWMGIARLPKALATVGFRVATFCRADSFLSKTRYAEHGFGPPTTGSPFSNLANAVRQFQPDLLIPACESAVNFLHEVVRAGLDGRLSADYADIVSLAKRSLGDPEYYGKVLSKHATLEIASELGLRTPQQSHISAIEDAVGFADLHGYPVVLKGEFGCAGQEVKICATADEIAAAFQFLNRTGNPRNPRVVAQQYVQGVSAMHLAVAASGNVLESLTLLKERTHPQLTGPSSVVKLIVNDEAAHTVSSLMKKLAYSGFGHCDFILESGSQAAYLLEFNPRPGPACGLGGLFGHDLCRALGSYLSDVPYQRQPSSGNHKTAALFPNEWIRDPQSPFLTGAYHDVPWDDPLLLRAYMQAKGV
jgi:carbamoyl-phosphate synthase large subunit